MASASSEAEITDHIAAFLLRYFRKAVAAQFTRPYIDANRDRDLLRLHWAVSKVIVDLTSYVLQHRHEIQSVLTTALRIEDCVVRGRIDARATVLRRRTSGLATAIISQEPLRSYDSGPNQVLIWVLMQAWSYAARFAGMLPESASYRDTVDVIVQQLEQVRRIQSINLMSGEFSGSKRPGAAALLAAKRSRREVYQRAFNAYEALLQIEAGDPEAITRMLRDTLLAPLEVWRRYELAVAFGIAEALSAESGVPMTLNLLINNTSAIVRAGRFSIFWQSRTELSQPPVLEPSDIATRRILDCYGFGAASDRPDLVVIDDAANAVAAVVEVKYLTAEDASDRIRDAATQLVRYAKLYHPIDLTGPLLGRSLIAVNQGLDAFAIPPEIPSDIPLIIDFAAIQRGQLSEWARRLHP